ncbi:MAG: hypothetical protein IT323_04965 [Anaerolineae bacterium]|nr:hypothetical protein [Anaerolineae bacterium]
MSDVTITIRLPEELIERARAAGVTEADQAALLAEAVEREIVRRETAAALRQLAERMSLSEGKRPTPEQVNEALRAIRADMIDNGDLRPTADDTFTSMLFQLWSMPDDFKPSTEAIQAEIEAYWAMQSSSSRPETT